jgi:hypothetical protein
MPKTLGDNGHFDELTAATPPPKTKHRFARCLARQRTTVNPAGAALEFALHQEVFIAWLAAREAKAVISQSK